MPASKCASSTKLVQTTTTIEDSGPEPGWHYINNTLATKYKHWHIVTLCSIVSLFLCAVLGVVIYWILIPSWWYLPFWTAPHNLPHSFEPLDVNITLEFALHSYLDVNAHVIGHVQYTIRCIKHTDMINLYATDLHMLTADITITSITNGTQLFTVTNRLVDPVSSMWALVVQPVMVVGHTYRLHITRYGTQLRNEPDNNLLYYSYVTDTDDRRFGVVGSLNRRLVPGWDEPRYNGTSVRLAIVRSSFAYRRDVYLFEPGVPLGQIGFLLSELAEHLVQSRNGTMAVYSREQQLSAEQLTLADQSEHDQCPIDTPKLPNVLVLLPTTLNTTFTFCKMAVQGIPSL